MKKYFLVLSIFTCIALSACGTENYIADETIEHLEYIDNYIKVENNGTITYLADSREYSCRITVTGRSNNAVNDSYYIVLTNDDSISFTEVPIFYWMNV